MDGFAIPVVSAHHVFWFSCLALKLRRAGGLALASEGERKFASFRSEVLKGTS